MKPWIGPPIFLAAEMALREPWFSFPSLCSRIASVEASRRRAAGLKNATGEVVACVSLPRSCCGTILRAVQSILCMWFDLGHLRNQWRGGGEQSGVEIVIGWRRSLSAGKSTSTSALRERQRKLQRMRPAVPGYLGTWVLRWLRARARPGEQMWPEAAIFCVANAVSSCRAKIVPPTRSDAHPHRIQRRGPIFCDSNP